MTQLQIFTDSLSDLPKAWMDQYHIGIVPAYVVFSNDKVFKDSVDLSVDQICRLVLEQGQVPGIAAPSTYDLISAFAPVISAGKDILFVSMSSGLSPAYKNAIAAAGAFPSGRVQVVDSASLSSGTALMVMHAVNLARKGLHVTPVVKRLQQYRQDMQFTMLLDHTGTPGMRGNVYGLENQVKGPFALRTDGKVKTGKIRAANKHSGKSASAVDAILQEILDNQLDIDPKLVIISQTLAEQQAEYLKGKLTEMTSMKTIMIAPSICGLLCRAKPRSLAVGYAMKPSRTKPCKQEAVR